jgi:hypothetical protein
MDMKPKAAWLLVHLIVPLTATPASITDLAWLSGCWAAANQQKGSGELWMSPAGGTMLGISRMVGDGKTIDFEFLRIVQTDDGGLVYIASPSGQDTIGFALISLGEAEVVFENPSHDFPQRIIYRLQSEEDLLGRIEGTINGVERAVEFPMTKTECGAG